jgi:cytochrome c-type biogenesis protein CcmH
MKRFLVVLMLGWVMPALAVIDGYQFDDEVTRQRYLSFIEELRCPKCQNQNLAGSDSPIAADLRRELYRLLEDGQSDKEIVDFMVARYGDYVLYRPQVKRDTWLLWGLPAGLLLFGLLMVAMTVRQRHGATKADAKVEEDVVDVDHDKEQRLKLLLAAAKERQEKKH